MKFKKFLACALSTMMALSVLPAATVDVSAATTTPVEDGGMVLSKTATLEDDGTYTINLEAFATGQSQTITVEQPTDIVLVLDVSGSMDETITYTTGYSYSDPDEYIYKTPTDLYHHCADGSYGTITWTEKGRAGLGTYRYVCDNCKATRKYGSPTTFKKIPTSKDDDGWNLWVRSEVTQTVKKMDALQGAATNFVNAVAAKNEALTDKHRVALVKFAGNNSNSVGNDVYGNNKYNYSQVVDPMTTVDADGAAKISSDIRSLTASGATSADYGMTHAKNQLANSGNRQKVVIMFTDGEPNHQNGFDASVANSTISTAKELKGSGTVIYTIGVFAGANAADTSNNTNAYMNAVSSNYPNATAYNNRGSGSNKGYYKVFTNAAELNDIFKEISQSIGTTSVTLNSSSVTKDVLGDGFVLTANSTVSAQSIKYSGRDQNGVRVFESSGNTLTARTTGNTVSVTGFDFSKNYLLDGDSVDDKDFRKAKQGYKLAITITGVEATDDAITNDIIDTNAVTSGVYASASTTAPAVRFPQPKTQLNSKAYVLDYAKEAVLTEMPNTVSHIATGMNKFASANSALSMAYGTAGLNSYTPTTTNWNGYDSYYGFGKFTATPDAVTTGDNTWTKVSVLPANNVYYEDTFTTENGASVGIVYSGNWEKANEGNNNADVKEDEQGWISDMAGETGYSDGTVSVGSKGATATFTFTGTGVDVYSRTDMTTGMVRAQLYNGEEVKAASLSKFLTVDNLAKSAGADGYYQIPTVSFTNLEYGTYTVKLTVGASTTAATGTVRSTYYLDGIRIYNPLSENQEADKTVVDAYGNEIGAAFIEVRDILLDAETLSVDSSANGIVFIDSIKQETGVDSSEIGKYENFGPANEVYLKQGQAIAFQISDMTKVSVGIKAPNGTTTASISNGASKSPVTVDSAFDQYYPITPDNGIVVIKNTGANLLAVTKLKVAGESTGVETFAMPMMLAYVDGFDSLPETEYSVNGSVSSDDNDAIEEDVPGDVIIDNPDDEAVQQPETAKSWVDKLLGGIKNIFKR